MSSTADQMRALAARKLQRSQTKKRKTKDIPGGPSKRRSASSLGPNPGQNPQEGVRISVPLSEVIPAHRGPSSTPSNIAPTSSPSFSASLDPHTSSAPPSSSVPPISPSVPLVGSSSRPDTPENLSAPIFQPAWSVTEQSTVRRFGTAVDIGSNLSTPFDRAHFSVYDSSMVTELAFGSVAHLGVAIRGLSDHLHAEQERRRAALAQVGELSNKLGEEKHKREESEQEISSLKAKEEKYEREILTLKAKDASSASLLANKDQLLAQKEADLSQSRSEVIQLKEEMDKLRAEIAEAPGKAITDFKTSGGYLKALFEAYTTCWEDASALCVEKGNQELSALMQSRADTFRDTDNIEAEEEDEGEGDEDEISLTAQDPEEHADQENLGNLEDPSSS